MQARFKDRMGEVHHLFAVGGDRDIGYGNVGGAFADLAQHVTKARFSVDIIGPARVFGDGRP